MRLVESVAPLVAIATVPISTVAAADRLPDPIATHWSLGSIPNGAMSPTTYVVLFAVLALFVWFVTMVFEVGRINLVTRSRRMTHREQVMTCYGVVAFLLGVHVVVLAANLDVADWHDARFAWWGIVAAAVVGFAAALVGRAVARER